MFELRRDNTKRMLNNLAKKRKIDRELKMQKQLNKQLNRNQVSFESQTKNMIDIDDPNKDVTNMEEFENDDDSNSS